MNNEYLATAIRLLSKINGKTLEKLPNYFTDEYELLENTIEVLINSGYLTHADARYNLSYTYTIPELKRILERNALPTKGKKEDLVERIFCNLKGEKLPPVSTYYIATDAGEKLLAENEALLLYYNSSVKDCFDLFHPNALSDIFERQKEHPELKGAEILTLILEDLIAKETSAMSLFSMTKTLQLIYRWLEDTEKVKELEERLAQLDILYWQEYEAESEAKKAKAAKGLGFTVEELERIEKEARDELGITTT